MAALNAPQHCNIGEQSGNDRGRRRVLHEAAGRSEADGKDSGESTALHKAKVGNDVEGGARGECIKKAQPKSKVKSDA